MTRASGDARVRHHARRVNYVSLHIAGPQPAREPKAVPSRLVRDNDATDLPPGGLQLALLSSITATTVASWSNVLSERLRSSTCFIGTSVEWKERRCCQTLATDP